MDQLEPEPKGQHEFNSSVLRVNKHSQILVVILW